MNKKLSDKDLKDWNKFIKSKDKINAKDELNEPSLSKNKSTFVIDLHGYGLDQANKFVAFAAGSGITPVMSMIKGVANENSNSRFLLFYGNKTEQDVIFKNQLDDLVSDRIEVHYLYTQQPASSDLLSGRINASKSSELMKSKMDWLNADGFFMCGPEQMIMDVKQSLQSFGVVDDKINYELFTVPVLISDDSKPVEVEADFDGDSMVTVICDDEEVEFALSMNESMGDNPSETIRTKQLSSSGLSRINEVQHVPADTSSCQIICQSEDVACGEGIKTLLSNDDRFYVAKDLVFGTKTICTNRSLQLNDGVAGRNGNYVIDGNPSPTRSNPNDIGVTLEGGSKRNILLGTPADDILVGGPDHDGLIGRGGNDELYGKAGNDNMVPWTSTAAETTTVTVNGGDGFDRVYLKGDESSYTLSCSGSSCTLQSNTGGRLLLSNVEMLVFKTSSNRLAD